MKLKELLEVTGNYLRIDLYKESDPEGVIQLLVSRDHKDDSFVLTPYLNFEVSDIVPGIYGQHDSPYMNIILTSRINSSNVTNEKKTFYKIVKEDFGESFMDGILFTDMNAAKRYVNCLDSIAQLYNLNELWFGRKHKFEIIEVQL